MPFLQERLLNSYDNLPILKFSRSQFLIDSCILCGTLEPIDSVTTEFVSGNNLTFHSKNQDDLVNVGSVFLKPSNTVFNYFISTCQTNAYDEITGWGGNQITHMGMQGLLSFCFQHLEPDCAEVELASFGVKSCAAAIDCQQSWSCFVDPNWTVAQAQTCLGLNSACCTHRQTFEKETWLKSATVADGVHEPEHFLGCCDAESQCSSMVTDKRNGKTCADGRCQNSRTCKCVNDGCDCCCAFAGFFGDTSKDPQSCVSWI